MNERCRTILQILLKSDNYLSLQKISEMLDVSKRSIYYDLCRINEWLEENDIPELEVVRKKGILIDDKVKAQIEACAEDTDQEDYYILSPTERASCIICSIIYAQEAIYVEQLMDYCVVSRNTIFNDLRVVLSQLQEYDLKLEYESKTGYQITGDEIRIRAIFLMHLYKLQSAIQAGAIHFFYKEKTEVYLNKLKMIEEALNREYVEGTLRSLAMLLPVMEKGNANLYFPNLKKEEVMGTREYRLIENFFGELEEKEKIYLCLHLLGARVNLASEDIFASEPNQDVYEITKALVAEFERVACVIFDDREELERALFVHISASLYRYRFGIQMGDVISEDIIREYPDLFEITKMVSSYIEKQIGMPIPDSEVAYLALHFGSHLSVSNQKSSTLRILVVCANGMSTGNMLKREVQKLLPAAEIVGVKASSDVQNVQNICDIVISTVNIKCVVPVIFVHPILTDMEREMILEHPKVQGVYTGYNVDKILEIIEPYVQEKDRDKVKKELLHYLRPQKHHTKEKVHFRKGLLETLQLSNMAIHTDTMSWMKSIKVAGKTLCENGSIEKSYLEKIISQTRYYGPYMFIVPGVVLAHAKPEDGVNHMDVALHIFKNEIPFSDFHKAHVILVLAVEDQESHLHILKDIVSLFSKENCIEELLKLENTEEVYQYLHEVIANSEEE